MQYIILLIGFILLVKGADIFVDGAKDIARFFKIPSVIIGLTIVSIGTSLPEASVSITAGFLGSNDIALGNVIGSNIFNTAMVLGACAIIKPINSHIQILKRDMPLMFIVSIITVILMLDGMFSRFDAGILLVFFVYFIASLVKEGMKSNEEEEDEGEINLIKATIFSIIGVVLIKYGGDFVVSSAQNIALSFGISENVVGLTIVAVGTSLPELVTSLVAAKKGESDIALGNVIGSNMFNLLFILGSSAVLTPIAVSTLSVIDMSVFILMAAFAFIMFFKNKILTRMPAIVLLASYVSYMVYVVVR